MPLPEADLRPDVERAEATSGRLSLGAVSWSVFEGARDPYVILIIIYIFMPYVGSVMVGWPHSNPTAGQEVISQWSQYSGWATMATAPFLGASIDQTRSPQGLAGACRGADAAADVRALVGQARRLRPADHRGHADDHHRGASCSATPR